MKKLVKSLCAVVALFAIALCLVACAPKDAKAAKEKLEKAGYTAKIMYEKTGDEAKEGAIANVSAVKGSSIGGVVDGVLGGDFFSATLYASSKEAKQAYEDSKDSDGKTSLQLIGNWVVGGEEEAIKAFK